MAIRVANDGDLFAVLDRAGQRQRARHRAHRIEDDVAGITQPNEFRFGNAEHFGHQRIQARVNAGERDNRQRVGELLDALTGLPIAGERAVIGVHNGFKKAHIIIQGQVVASSAHRTKTKQGWLPVICFCTWPRTLMGDPFMVGAGRLVSGRRRSAKRRP